MRTSHYWAVIAGSFAGGAGRALWAGNLGYTLVALAIAIPAIVRCETLAGRGR